MKTLQLKRPLGFTLLLAGSVLAIVLASTELLSRTPFAKSFLPIQSYGTDHTQFDLQMERFKERVAREGKINCLMIGNSQVLYNIDPAIVEEVFFKETGEKITCQAFALGGMPPSTSAIMAKILVEQYHPSILVYGTGAMDYTNTNATVSSINSKAWIRYRLGESIFDGWLIDSSTAYRYFLGINRNLYQPIAKDSIMETGHATYKGNATLSLEEQIEYFSGFMKNAKVYGSDLKGYAAIAELNSEDIHVVTIETPMRNVSVEMEGKFALLIKRYKQEVSDIAKEYEIPFWQTQELNLIPDEGWYDIVHLNEDGAVIFSRYLGEKLAEYYLQNGITLK